MNDSQVKQQIQQMVSFIRQEAEDKANEIRTKAEEDFNIRKLNAVNDARLKIGADYAKKEKAIDVNRKIAQSTEQNNARLQVLKARDSLLEETKAEAGVALSKLPNDDPSAYEALISDMILQGLIKLGDDSVAVRTRCADKSLVEGKLEDVAARYSEKMGRDVELSIDDTNLADDCTGGVTLVSGGGKIVVENTFETRLQIAYQQNLPVIRGVLFADA